MANGEHRLKRYYKNKESREIERFLNKAREKINKEAGFEVIKYPVKILFRDDNDDPVMFIEGEEEP